MAVSIMQWNAHSLRSNKDQLKNFLINTSNPPDVICIEETFLKKKHQSPKIDGYNTAPVINCRCYYYYYYNIVRKDCTSNEKGGLVIYIKLGLNFTLLSVEETLNVEIQGIEIKTSSGHLKMFNVYLSPTNILTKEDFQKYFFNNRTILVGDFNA